MSFSPARFPLRCIRREPRLRHRWLTCIDLCRLSANHDKETLHRVSGVMVAVEPRRGHTQVSPWKKHLSQRS